MLVPGSRLRHPLPACYQSHAQGNAAGGQQATDPVWRRRGAGCRSERDLHRHRSRQARPEDHFDISYELENQIKGTDKEKYLVGIRRLLDECSFSYTRQTEMKGLGHAILTGRPLIGDEPFAVVLADDLCVNPEGDGILTQMVKLYNQFRCSIVAIRKSIRRKPTSTA